MRQFLRTLSIALTLLVACGSDDIDTPTLELPSHELPAAICDPTLSGTIAGETDVGVSRYAWDVDADSIRLNLGGAATADLGTIRTWLELNPLQTTQWQVHNTYTMDGDVAVSQTMKFRLLGSDQISLRIENQMGDETVVVWVKLDRNLVPSHITLGHPIAESATPTGAVTVTPAGRFETFDFVVDGDTRSADAWIAGRGLDSWLNSPIWQRFVTASNDATWIDAADSQARRCDAQAAGNAELGLLGIVQQGAGCGSGSGSLQGVGNAWNLIGAVGTAMAVTGALIAAGVITSGLAIGATLVIAGLAGYYVGSVIEGALAPHGDTVMGGAIDGAAGAYEGQTGDSLGTGAAKSFFVGGESAKSSADPHLDTFDGRAYDFQGAGEFVLARSDGFEVQTRQQPVDGACDDVSLNTAVAIRVGAHRLAFYVGEDKPIVDGQPTDLPGAALVLEDATLERVRDGVWRLWWLTGEAIEIQKSRHINVRVHLPESRHGRVQGLLGNFDGEGGNDLATSDGQLLASPIDWDVIAGAFADSWRVDASNTLFDYDSGQGPETFVIPGFPARPLTLAALSDEQRESAGAICEAAGIANPIVMHDCIVDVACTGDSDYAQSHTDRDPLDRVAMDTPLFLDGWSVQGEPTNGQWTVSADGRAVEQTSNGDPTFFVSPQDHFDTTIRGRLISTGGDDDYMGFVFGFRNPLGTLLDNFETFVVSWKGVTQTGASEGVTLAHAKGVITDIDTTFWQQNSTTEYTVLASHTPLGSGWLPNTTYNFELKYGAAGIAVSLGGLTIFDLAADTLPVSLLPGRFGFYNYSQPNVTYSDFTLVASTHATLPSCMTAQPFPELPAAGAFVLPGNTAYLLEKSLTVTVPMTIEAGALICAGTDVGISVTTGTLTVEGMSGNPVRFLGDRQTSGFWRGILFTSGSGDNSMTHAEVAYAGSTAAVSVEAAGIAVDSGATLRLADSLIRNNAGWGLWAEGTGPVLVTGNSHFRGNERAGARVAPNQLSGLSETASYAGGNGDGDTVWVSQGSLSEPGRGSWPKLDASWRVAGPISIEQPVTIAAGAHIMMHSSAYFDVRDPGSLHMAGTQQQPIRIEAHNAASPWRGIRYAAAAAQNLIEYTTIRGAGGQSLVSVESANVAVDGAGTLQIKDSAFTHSAAWGVWVDAGAAFVATGANSFSDNAGAGLRIAPEHMGDIDAAGQFVGNNGQDVVWVSGGSIGADATWQALDAPYLLTSVTSVDAVVTVASGANFRLELAGAIDVRSGALLAVGTRERPIRFSGAQESAGSHRGIRIASGTPASVLEYVEMAHGGGTALVSVEEANVSVDGSGSLEIANSSFSSSAAWGVWVENGASFIATGANQFLNNANAGLRIAPEHMGSIDGAGQFVGGNGQDVVWVNGGAIGSDATWQALDAPYLLTSIASIDAHVTVAAGATVRFDTSAGLDVRGGSLRAVGAADNFIRFLGLTESAGSHRGIRIASNSPASTMQFVELAHGGGAPLVSVQAANIGVDASGSLDITDSIIRDSAGWGIYSEGPVVESSNSFSGNVSGDVGP